MLCSNASHGHCSCSHKPDRGARSGKPPNNNHSFILCFLSGTVYLDHAGATLFPQSQLTNFTQDLLGNVYGKEGHTVTVFFLFLFFFLHWALANYIQWICLCLINGGLIG